jgi:hypothetical protein
VKGSGIANTCPVMDGGSSNLRDLKPGNYNINKFCLEPTSFTVKEDSQFKGGESEFVKTKLMTRLTYTLDEVRARPARRAPPHPAPRAAVAQRAPPRRSPASSTWTATATWSSRRRTASTTRRSPSRCPAASACRSCSPSRS